MTSISKLLFGADEPNDHLRYAKRAHRRPIVVWNVTPRCNLSCSHCYASNRAGADRVLNGDEARAVIDDLAAWGVPVLLFSGGEPFCREDIRELSEYAKSSGLRVTFSTNGTLIDDDTADWLASFGTGYVGISIDGTERMHDDFRRKAGAYASSLAAVRRLVSRGAEGVPRVCFYHLVYTGRGNSLIAEDLSPEERMRAIDTIIAETERAHSDGFQMEVLTVDNHCDGPYLYMKHPSEERLRLLELNGGNSSGQGIACISWDGTVFPDQFWRNRPVGNVRETPFSQIWGTPPEGSLLDLLRRKKEFVRGRCRMCQWLDVCGGNFRARGEAATGDIWGEDPSCYLR